MRVAELEIAESEWVKQSQQQPKSSVDAHRSGQNLKGQEDAKGQFLHMEEQQQQTQLQAALQASERNLQESTKELQVAQQRLEAKDAKVEALEATIHKLKHLKQHHPDFANQNEHGPTPAAVATKTLRQSQGEGSQESNRDGILDESNDRKLDESLPLSSSLNSTLTDDSEDGLKSRNVRAAKVIKELSSELVATKAREKRTMEKYSRLKSSIHSLQEQKQELKRSYQELHTKAQAKDEGVSRRLAMLTEAIDTIRMQSKSPKPYQSSQSIAPILEGDDPKSNLHRSGNNPTRSTSMPKEHQSAGGDGAPSSKSRAGVSSGVIQYIPNTFPTAVAHFTVRTPTHPDSMFDDFSDLSQAMYASSATVTDATSLEILAKIGGNDGIVMFLSGPSHVVICKKGGRKRIHANFDEEPHPLGWTTYSVGTVGKHKSASLDEVYENAQLYRHHYCQCVLAAQSNPRFVHAIGLPIKRTLARILYSSQYGEMQKASRDCFLLALAVLVVGFSLK